MSVECARVIKSKKTQCPNEGVVHYGIIDRGQWITYSLCRKHSPNISKEQKKLKGDKIFKSQQTKRRFRQT